MSRTVEQIKKRLVNTTIGRWKFESNTLLAGDKCVLVVSQLPAIEDAIFIEEAKDDIKFLLTELDRRASWPKKVGKKVGEIVLGNLIKRSLD